jgi:hypothetical protein
MFGQSFGDGAADPSRGARDDGDALGEVEQTGQSILPKGQRALRRSHCSRRRRQRRLGKSLQFSPRLARHGR